MQCDAYKRKVNKSVNINPHLIDSISGDCILQREQSGTRNTTNATGMDQKGFKKTDHLYVYIYNIFTCSQIEIEGRKVRFPIWIP